MDKLRQAKLDLIQRYIEDIVTDSPVSTMRYKDIIAEELLRDLEAIDIEEFERDHMMALEEEYRERYGSLPF